MPVLDLIVAFHAHLFSRRQLFGFSWTPKLSAQVVFHRSLLRFCHRWKGGCVSAGEYTPIHNHGIGTAQTPECIQSTPPAAASGACRRERFDEGRAISPETCYLGVATLCRVADRSLILKMCESQ